MADAQPPVSIREWDFEHGVVHLDVGDRRATIAFRTAAEGGQRAESAVEAGQVPIWAWDGDRDEPTLSPSIRLSDAHFHIRDGEIVA